MPFREIKTVIHWAQTFFADGEGSSLNGTDAWELA